MVNHSYQAQSAKDGSTWKFSVRADKDELTWTIERKAQGRVRGQQTDIRLRDKGYAPKDPAVFKDMPLDVLEVFGAYTVGAAMGHGRSKQEGADLSTAPGVASENADWGMYASGAPIGVAESMTGKKPDGGIWIVQPATSRGEGPVEFLAVAQSNDFEKEPSARLRFDANQNYVETRGGDETAAAHPNVRRAMEAMLEGLYAGKECAKSRAEEKAGFAGKVTAGRGQPSEGQSR